MCFAPRGPQLWGLEESLLWQLWFNMCRCCVVAMLCSALYTVLAVVVALRRCRVGIAV